LEHNSKYNDFMDYKSGYIVQHHNDMDHHMGYDVDNKLGNIVQHHNDMDHCMGYHV
jgi:hypothetical protein